MTSNLSDYINTHQYDYMLKSLDNLPVSGFVPPLTDWAEEKRFLPSGTTEVAGQFNRNVAPHLNEILECLHPDSPYTHVTSMKSVQSANTTTVAENGMGAWIDYKLGSCLFLTSTKGIGNIRSSSAIDVMIDNAKLKIKPMSERMKRKTGDKANYKEFAGNIKLLISSYRSIADLKSNTFHFIVCDEWDEAAAELKGQGDIAGIIDGRTMGLRRYKVLYISTPSEMKTSRIYKSFLEGDQRKFNMPCPLCGELQIPNLKGRGLDYGLTFTREKHERTGNKILIPESVRYTCKHCKKDFYESKKQWMLENGVWIPTAIPEDRKKASFHSPGFISPFLGWERMCQQFINTKFGEDVLKFKDFTINYLGLPWANQEKTPEWQTLKDRSEDYSLGEVPPGEIVQENNEQYYNGGLVLFGGVDVQGDRLELKVTAFGADSNRWIVDKKVFFGKTENIDDPCYYNLDDFVYNHTYKILDIDCFIMGCGMDCGYDPRYAKRGKDFSNKASIVYDFVADRQDRFIAVMGVSKEKTMGIIKEAKISDVRTSLTKRYNVHVSALKELIMNVIDKSNGYGTIHFPKYQMIGESKKEIPNNFYQGFLSEVYSEISPGKYGWKKIFERNENLDTYIYSVAAAEYFGVNNWNRDNYMRYYYDLLSD